MKLIKITNHVTLFITILFLSGCHDIVLINSKGQIGIEQRSLILIALGVMLIVVIPVIIMAITFAIKYRASNKKATYNPSWSHSKNIECVVWSVPILIVIFLSIITWKSTHSLDPNNSILSDVPPITIEVVALDWKWLFIYPEYKIATINEVVFPYNVPIKFKITSNSVMNSFFIPQLGSQIYAMAGMSSTLHLIANEAGIYKGMSSNFSGHGFSGMKFNAIATTNYEEFNNWINKVQNSRNLLNTLERYEQLAIPSEYNKVQYFSNIKSDLYNDIILKFMGKKNCMLSSRSSG